MSSVETGAICPKCGMIGHLSYWGHSNSQCFHCEFCGYSLSKMIHYECCASSDDPSVDFDGYIRTKNEGHGNTWEAEKEDSGEKITVVTSGLENGLMTFRVDKRVKDFFFDEILDYYDVYTDENGDTYAIYKYPKDIMLDVIREEEFTEIPERKKKLYELFEKYIPFDPIKYSRLRWFDLMTQFLNKEYWEYCPEEMVKEWINWLTEKEKEYRASKNKPEEMPERQNMDNLPTTPEGKFHDPRFVKTKIIIETY